MKERLLYQIRNIGSHGRASYKAVKRAEALRLVITAPEFPVFVAHVVAENMTIPGYANLDTTKEMQAELPKIIAGDSERWHLWRAMVYRERLELEYADLRSKERYPKATSLRCWLDWPEELQMTILTPDPICKYYELVHLAPDASYDRLSIRYPNPKKQGLVETETYETEPETGREYQYSETEGEERN